jgi:glutamate-1-semialdehyde 2,1-aminomutase
MEKKADQLTRYRKSELHLIRAETTIPLGSQTFSKSRTQYPVGISPLYLTKASGCFVWDLDGHKYIDLVSSLASITIGYGDRRINKSVRKQLSKGVSFSLPGILEAEVAEYICDMVPSAEMVRFGKNGTDATSAAVRLARAYTGRERIAVCGYHGWQDWYIGSTTRNKGVPHAVSELTHKFSFNNLDSLIEITNKHQDIACIVMEPMNATYPIPGFLEGVRELADKIGAILIFDETITGFRFAKGGAQELFGVIPDLSTFGKGIANGFPLSAVAGKKEIMMEMEEIFFSGTFGGELLSLAAAKKVLELHRTDNVTEQLNYIGTDLASRIERVISDANLTNIISLSGHPTWKFINWKSTDALSSNSLRTYFWQNMFQRGILLLGTHNVSLAHTSNIRKRIVDTYQESLGELANGIRSGDLLEKLRATPPEELFKIR